MHVDQPCPTNVVMPDNLAMLRDCIPTLKAELYAAQFVLAKETSAPDLKFRRARFLQAAEKIKGGMPPMTETALGMLEKSNPHEIRRWLKKLGLKMQGE